MVSAANIEAAKAALAHLDIDDHEATVRNKSRDFFWYSPVLKERLDHVTADFVVTPRSEAEVAEILKVCYEHDVPVTGRGSGTGNYGQAMPLSGGVVIHLKEMNKIKEVAPGRVVAEAGAILSHIDKEAIAQSGQELRMHPSTYHTASIGGFLAGGSGGIGSVRWSNLSMPGNILRMRLVTMEAEPKIIDLEGDDIQQASHAYGVNGIITEVEVPLTQSFPWVDVIVGFEGYIKAVEHAVEIADNEGILVKELAPIAAPIGHDYFLRHKKFLPREKDIVVAMVAPHSMTAFLSVTKRLGGEVLFRADQMSEAELKGLPPGYELTWNHTTLRALRVDPSITYLQVQYGGDDPIATVAKMEAMFGDEVPLHLEITRHLGSVRLSGLPLVRYSNEPRLDEIMDLHEANDCWIFNPHRFTLEEGGMKQSDPLQLAFKKQNDPKGLLNPGKMIAFEDPTWDFTKERFYPFPGLKPKVES